MKSNQMVECIIDEVAQTLTFKVDGHKDVPIVHLLKLTHPDNIAYAALHGFKQRDVDGAAVDAADKKTGIIRTYAERCRLKHERIARLVEHYNSGAPDWDLMRSAGGGIDNTGLTIEAIGRVYDWDIATVEVKVDTLAQKKGIDRRATLATYANIPDVAAMIGTIKAERAARLGLDAASMAEELMAA